LFLVVKYYIKGSTVSAFRNHFWRQSPHSGDSWGSQSTTSQDHSATTSDDISGVTEDAISQTHRQVFSVSTPGRRYFSIDFYGQDALNPSIIPHPKLYGTWIIVAQRAVPDSLWFSELVCNAAFKEDGTLCCVNPPIILPIAATAGDKCVGDLEYFQFNIGPHDARAFYGPRMPYAIYGSNSQHTCFGQWLADFRMLTDWGFEPFDPKEFRRATEIQRPAPYRPIEKNWFLFWDVNDQLYVHYDISPKRVFAKLDFDGSIGQDLALLAAVSDEKCLAQYIPTVNFNFESVHQATNSLSVTLCRRSDPACEPNEFNTFILTIFQHKSFYSFHSVYEPYVMLFQQRAPFEIHAISSKPIWIHGRGNAGKGRKPTSLTIAESESWNQTEMFYVTSVSWKKHGQRYHGYADDVLFIAFGIEDSGTGAIDVVAGDLLADLSLCATL
jgi:hypothetical protein